MTAITADEFAFAAARKAPLAPSAPTDGARRGLKAQLAAYVLYVVGIAAAIIAV